MKTVKKLQPETVTSSFQLRPGIEVETRTQKCVTFAVVDEESEIVVTANGQREIYQQKATAQRVADWYNAR